MDEDTGKITAEPNVRTPEGTGADGRTDGGSSTPGAPAFLVAARFRRTTAALGGPVGRAASALLATASVPARAGRALAAHHLGRRIGMGVAMLLVTLAGVSLGLLLFGRTDHDVGPFSARFQITPSVSGGTDVEIPPLGSLHLSSHDGPAHLTVRLDALDPKRTEALLANPNGIADASQTAVTDVEAGVTKLVLQAAGAAVLGGLLLSALVFRNARRVAVCGGLSLVTVAASAGIAFGTFRPGSVEETTFHGLLTKAPAVVGDARRIEREYSRYRDELQRLVNNVSRLYATFSTLPVYEPATGTVRVLHISDLHLNPAAWSVIETVVKQFDIDLVIDTGDINDWGTPMESSFVAPIGSLGVPYVYVRGNHDSALTVAAVARAPNAIVLDNCIATVRGLTIAGIGDPRFTPDKQTQGVETASAHQALSTVYRSGEELARTIRDAHRTVDVALIHDPAAAGAFAGVVPLVLAGHLHAEQTETLPAAPGQRSTFVMVEGSTGGAGLRGLEGEQPTPLEMSVLYFDPDHALQAYDDISVGGTGRTEVTLNRHVMADRPPVPSPSGSGPASLGP